MEASRVPGLINVFYFISMGTNAWSRRLYFKTFYACLSMEVKTQERRGAGPGSQGHAKRVRSPPVA